MVIRAAQGPWGGFLLFSLCLRKCSEDAVCAADFAAFAAIALAKPPRTRRDWQQD